MNRRSKKGYTLVEIIVVVAIIAILGVASFFGVRLVSKNVTINKLEKITDKVLLAAEVYIETNKETYKQLYNEENSVIIPLNVLVNEGLLTLENTDISSKNIENEYIIATLANGGGADTDCIDITTNASWNLSKDNPIYICNNKSSGTNSIIIGGTNSNIDTVKVQEEVTESDGIYNFSGGDNYITYKNKTYRIILVDRDDSLVLGTTESTFGNVFNGKTQKYASCPYGLCYETFTTDYNKSYYSLQNNVLYKDNKCTTPLSEGEYKVYYQYSRNGYLTGEGLIYRIDRTPKNGEVSIMYTDLSALDLNIENTDIYYQGYLYYIHSSYGCSVIYSNKSYGDRLTIYNRGPFDSAKKLKLKSCMKITGGTGTEVNPYELSDLC